MPRTIAFPTIHHSARLPIPSAPTDRLSRGLAAAALALICIGLFFRCYHLDRKVIWEDELFATIHVLGYTEAQIVNASPALTTAAQLQQYFHPPAAHGGAPNSIAATVTSLADEDPQHPPLYYAVAHVWTDRFGSSVTALRSLSAVFGILALACVYFLGIELFASRTTALLATVLLAVSPFHVLYAQEVREYSLWTAAILVLSLTFLRAVRLGTWPSWLLYAVTLALSMYVFPFTGLVALGQGAFLLVTQGLRPSKTLARYAIACGAGLATFVPWFAIMIRSAGLTRGMAAILTTHVSPPAVLATLARNIRGVFIDVGLFHAGHVSSTLVNTILTGAVVLFLLYVAAALYRSGNRRSTAFIAIALCVPMLPLLLRDLVWGGELVVQSRYFTPLYLGLELAVAAFFVQAVTADGPAARGWSFGLGALIGVGVLSCAISSQATTWATKDFEQNRSVAQTVSSALDPLVISDVDTSRALGLGYYLDPSVKLRLHLHCDQCTVAAAPSGNLVADAASAGTVFLLGPSPELARAARAVAPDARIIGVTTFTDRTNPLTLFAPL